jgi:hypothetical protein
MSRARFADRQDVPGVVSRFEVNHHRAAILRIEPSRASDNPVFVAKLLEVLLAKQDQPARQHQKPIRFAVSTGRRKRV